MNDNREELAVELRQAINELHKDRQAKGLPPLIDDWMRSSWRGSRVDNSPEIER